jgi:ribonuclease G
MSDVASLQPDTILVARAPGETRYALLTEDALLAVVHRRDVEIQPGAVYFGRVKAMVPGVGAVFVDVGDDLPGVLPVKTPPALGSAVAVTIAVPPRPGKGAELKLAKSAPPAGAKVAGLVEPAPEPVTEWFARYGMNIRAIICQPLREAARIRALLGDDASVESHAVSSDLFMAYGVDEAIEAALQPEVKLPSGGSLIIETTRALTAIDVNSGGADPMKANFEAIPAAALELRRRNIAGHIVIDIIPTKARAALPRLMTKALNADPIPAQVAGLTPLGMLELTRQRTGLSLAETLLERGVVSAPTMAYRALRAAVHRAGESGAGGLVISVAPDVAAALKGPLARALAEARDAVKAEVAVIVKPDARRDHMDIRPA